MLATLYLDDLEFHPLVLRPAAKGAVVGNGLGLAISFPGDAIGICTLTDQVLTHTFCPVIGEFVAEIILRKAVRMSAYLHPDVWVLFQEDSYFIQFAKDSSLILDLLASKNTLLRVSTWPSRMGTMYMLSSTSRYPGLPYPDRG